jgi:excinuclease ABC subunit C
MDHDSADHPKTSAPPKARRGSQPDLPPQDLTLVSEDVDPAISATEEDDEARLPEAPD